MKELKFKTRIAIAFLVLSTFISFYLISFSYSKAITIQKSQLRSRLMQMAALSTHLVGPDFDAKVLPTATGENTPGYKALVRDLGAIKGIHEDIADVYILLPTAEPGKMKFLANADDKQPVGYGEEYDASAYPELLKAVSVPAADTEITYDKWGAWLSGYAPIKDAEGKTVAILGIDIAADTLAQMQGAIREKAIYAFLLSVFLSLLMSNLVSWWLTKPMKRLVKGMEEIQSGNLEHKMDVSVNDEFGKVGENFNRMAEELKKYIKDLTETTKEKERMNKELEIAAELQQAMLPHYDLNLEEVDIAGMSLPAKQVGGDYFDYINRDGRNIGFVVADATGKGLNSSIFMTNSRSIFKVLTTGEVSPSKVVQKTNDYVIKDVADAAAMFVTLFYGVYDRDEKIFHYCNAGHNPPLFFDRSADKVTLLSVHGAPIGIIEDQIYGEDAVKMDEGDAMILYTDGVVEMMNTKQEMFGLSNLIETVMRTKDLSAKDMSAAIKKEAFDFSETRPQFDDFTLLIFKVK